MFARLSPLGLLKWVALYCGCAAVPGCLLYFLPPEVLGDRVPLHGEEHITVRQVLGWFPSAMVGAAAVTLVTGIVCAGLNALAVLGSRALVDPNADAPHSAGREWLADALPAAYRSLRIALMLAGMCFVGVSVALVWVNVANGTLAAGINRILIALGGGAGLATGAAFYRN